MTRDEVAAFLKKIKSQWSNFPVVTKELVTIWEENIKDRKYDDCVLALKMYQNPQNDEDMRNSRFYPHPGDINGICRSIEEERRKKDGYVWGRCVHVLGVFPICSDDEWIRSREEFLRRCNESSNPVETATILSDWIDNLMAESANWDEEKRKNLNRLDVLIRGKNL